MPRPRLLRRSAGSGVQWSDPWEGGHEVESPYSSFILWLARLTAVLLVGGFLVMIFGAMRGDERLVWGSLAVIAPALFYLVMLYSWAWARSSLDAIDYGDEHADAESARAGSTESKTSRIFRPRRRRPGRTADRALLWRLARECRRYWVHIGVVLLISLAATPIFLMSPIPLKIAVDSVLENEPLPAFLQDNLPGFFLSSSLWLLVVAALLSVGVAFLSQLQSLASSVLSTYAGEKMSLDLRARMFIHAQRLSLAFHDTRGTSDTAYRVQYDSPAIQAVTIGGFIPIVSSSFTLVTAVIVAAAIDWQLCLVALGVAPVLFMSSNRFKNQMRPHYMGVKHLESKALGVVQEVLGSLRVVKAFGREEGEQGRFLEVSERGIKSKVRLAFAEGVFGMISGTTVSLGAAAVLFVGVRHVQTGVINLGELLIVMGYTAQLFKPLKTFTKQMGKLQSSLASAERVFELLDQEPEVTDRPDAVPLAHAIGEIEFSQVVFSYSPGKPVLEDVSFHIDPGSTIGIAGRTGAGKSTLLSLMMRFYEPDSGRIRFEGKDIREFKIADVRSQFALVLQEPVLFSTTIADNIRYGRPDASMDEVVAAAVAANAHSFISSIPDGYNSLVGERGMKLSGGERQRISLARAFLKNASILILDEPTSSVDVQTEAEIMGAMQLLMQGRTTLMIAHRLTTLENCDQVLFVDGRRVRAVDPSALPGLMASIDLAVSDATNRSTLEIDTRQKR